MSIYYGHILIKIFTKEIRAVRNYAAQNGYHKEYWSHIKVIFLGIFFTLEIYMKDMFSSLHKFISYYLRILSSLNIYELHHTKNIKVYHFLRIIWNKMKEFQHWHQFKENFRIGMPKVQANVVKRALMYIAFVLCMAKLDCK